MADEILFMFKNPFSFNGRIRRAEYGISLIIYLIFLVLIMMMKAVVTMKRRILNQPQLQAKLKATTKLFMVLLEQEKAHRLKNL